MIVERRWFTEKFKKCNNIQRKKIIRSSWVGFFLLGFIPLYIKEVERIEK